MLGCRRLHELRREKQQPTLSPRSKPTPPPPRPTNTHTTTTTSSCGCLRGLLALCFAPFRLRPLCAPAKSAALHFILLQERLSAGATPSTPLNCSSEPLPPENPGTLEPRPLQDPTRSLPAELGCALSAPPAFALRRDWCVSLSQCLAVSFTLHLSTALSLSLPVLSPLLECFSAPRSHSDSF